MYNSYDEHVSLARSLWADAMKEVDAAGLDAETFATAWLAAGIQLYAKVKGPEAAKALAARVAAMNEPPAGSC